MKVTLREWIHALNIFEEDKDITVDGIDSIAVVASCDGVKITPEGEERWGKILSSAMVDNCNIESDNEKELEEAWDFLISLAGFCSETNYEKWFEGDNAKLI